MGRDIWEQTADRESAYFIIVVSGYAWEGYFSEDLGHTLENCGGFLI